MNRLTASLTAAILACGSVVLPSTPAGAEEPVATPRALPMAPAVIQGTPKQILAETPVAQPLSVGYKPGMFLPPGAMTKKDKRGCSYRNRVLIALAVKQPKIGPKCVLSGGEWRADFGYTILKGPKAVKIGKLLPDKYVYAQGAYGWNATQRAAYANSAITPSRSSRMTNKGLLENNNIQLFSNKSFLYMQILNSKLDQTTAPQDTLQTELAALRTRNPGLFDSWTVATLLNAKAWGLSLSPGTAGEFAVAIEECSKKNSVTVNGKTYILIDITNLGKLNSQLNEIPNPCTNTYSVPNQASRYNITPVPLTASAIAPLNSQVLNGYGAPTGPAISRFMFGMHAPAHWTSDAGSGYDGPIEESSIPTVPVGSVRLWDTETAWADIEPQKGRFVYSKLQKQIELAQRLDARPMLVLGGTPAWAGGGGRNAVPTNVDDYKNYVRAVACHFGGSIFAYEVWNEANIKDFWQGSAAQMADLTQAAFEAIRGCNPGALVVAASTTTRATGSFGTFYPEYLNELKKRNWPVDAYSVHSYPAASGGSDERIIGIGQFKTMLALAGAPKTTIFDTETNYGLAGLGMGRVAYTGENAMALISRTYIDSARYGLDSTYWFVWTRGEDTKYGIQMNANAGNEHLAWRSTYDWLVGAQFQRCFSVSGSITVCQFNRGGDNFSIVWRGDVGTAASATPPGYFTGLGSRVCDLRATCISLTPSLPVSVGPEPIRIDGPPLSAGPAASSTPTPSDPAGPSGFPREPVILSLDLTYGPSNKADATARWAPPANAQQAKITGYSYTWLYCTGKKCVSVARGTTGAGVLQVTADLSKGPGTYRFEVAAMVGLTVGAPAQQDVVLQRSDAAPPSDVVIGVREGTGEIVWSAPGMRSELIAGYEVQIKNDASGKWVTVAESSSTRQVRFSASPDLDLAPGQSVTARVRTVLKSGAKSIYIPSSPLLISELLTPPTVVDALVTANTLLVYATPASNATVTTFPAAAFQVRYSTDGTTWDLAKFTGALRNTVTPDSNDTLVPYATGAFAIPSRGETFPSGARFQIRAIDNSGLQPSEWVDFTTRPLFG